MAKPVRARVILNRGGGSARDDSADRLKALFSHHGIDADVRAVAPEDLTGACKDAAAAEDCDIVAAAGGDGTIAAAAAALAGTGRPLGILPLGTLNHFARDAGIPADLDRAVRVIAEGRTRQVDLGEVNGRIFINNSAVGLYPMMIRERDEQQRDLGRSKRLAMLIAGLRGLHHFSRRRLTIRVAGREEPIVTPLLFVGNNRYETRLLSLGRREALDRGELCIYAPLARSRLHFLGLAMRVTLGRADQQRDFVHLDGVTEAEIRLRRPQLMVATDGEQQLMETPLRYRIRPRALTIMAPREAAAPISSRQPR